MKDDYIQWEAYEYEPRHHTSDWYWAVGIIALAIATIAVFFGNIVFAIVVALSAFTLCLFAARPPDIINLELNRKGILIDKRLYPHDMLQSFWIDTIASPKIIIKSKKLLMPYIIMPVHYELDHDDVRDFLKRHMKEVEHHEPLPHKILEYLGF